MTGTAKTTYILQPSDFIRMEERLKIELTSMSRNQNCKINLKKGEGNKMHVQKLKIGSTKP